MVFKAKRQRHNRLLHDHLPSTINCLVQCCGLLLAEMLMLMLEVFYPPPPNPGILSGCLIFGAKMCQGGFVPFVGTLSLGRAQGSSVRAAPLAQRATK